MPSGCLIKKREKGIKKSSKPMDSACKLQAACLSSWPALSFLEVDIFCFLVFFGQQWPAFQSNLSDLHSFLLLLAKELSSGEKWEKVTQVTGARLTFCSLTFWEFSINMQSLSPILPGPDPAASHLATPCQMGQDTCLVCTHLFTSWLLEVYVLRTRPRALAHDLARSGHGLDFRHHHFFF